MFRRGLAYLHREIDWAAIVGSALATAFAVLVLTPLAGSGRYYANGTANSSAYQWPPIWDWLASAAFWTAVFTLALTVSTILLWRETRRLAEGADDQLKHMAGGISATLAVANKTKEVADAMDEAASAMRQTAGISEAALNAAKRNSEKELRAYLSVEPAGVNQLIASRDGMGHVTVRNVGRIPAHGAQVRVHMFITTDENASLPTVDGDRGYVSRAIQPSASMRRGSDERLPVEELCKPGRYIFVWGVVYYDDGYENRRFTRFCHRYEASSYNRAHDWNVIDKTSRVIIESDKARYHHNGNDAN